jgi:hypothetical protein
MPWYILEEVSSKIKTMEEPLMSLHPKNCQEKLLWEKERVRSLTEENKKLLSQIDLLNNQLEELNNKMKSDHLGALILKTQKQKQTIKDLENKSKDLKSTNEHLLIRLARLQVK